MLKTTDVSSVLAGETTRRRGGRMTLVVVAAVAVLVLVAAGSFWWSGGFGAGKATFVTEPLQRGDIHVSLIATGTIEPVHTISVSSTQTGTIETVAVEHNQTVRKGDVLARLDLGALNARLRRALALVDVQSANRSMAQTNLADAEAALKRATALNSGALASAKDLELATSAMERARAGLQTAEAQLSAARADLAAAQDDFDSATIRAPIDGVVLSVEAEPGQTIGAASMGSPLFTIASDLSSLNLEAEIDEADIGQIAEGDLATFTVEAMADRPFTGTVSQVRLAPAVRDGVVNYTAIISVGNPDLLLKPGMTATTEIAVAEAAGVLTAPNAALRFLPAGASAPEAGTEHLYVLDAGQPKAVPVTVGLSDGLRSEIKTGEVAENDLVVTGTGGSR